MSKLSTKLPLDLLQTQWSTLILNPIISKSQNQGNLLTGISLTSGSNVINHLLARQMQGFYIADIDAPVTIYRSQIRFVITIL